MPRIDPIEGLAYNPYGLGDQTLEENPTAGDLLGAGFRTENPIVSLYRYNNHEPFTPDVNFDINEAARDDELFLDYGDRLAAAKSQSEYEWIRGRIQEEVEDQKTLAAGGWGGFAVATAAGMLSPSMLIPGFGPARGLKGMAQAFSLAAAGATADELALMESQFTRTGEDFAISVAANTILGGLLGTAARYMTPAERAAAEVDMAGTNSDRAILYPSGDGARMAARSGKLVDELSDLTPEELRALRAGDADGSLSAGSRNAPITGFYAGSKVSRALLDKLGKLNPVTRTVNQHYSKAARGATLQMQNAGLMTEGNFNFQPHADGGTVESRVKDYQAIEAQFIQRLDDAYDRHIRGDRLPEGELQDATIARVKAATKLPQGKMPHDQFNQEVFRTAQTGETHPDPNVNRAAKAWEDLAKEISSRAEEAFEFRRTQDPNARKLFDPDGNLGPDVEKWVTHVFSPETIAQRYDEFLNDLMDNAESNQNHSFQKAYEKFDKRRQQMNQIIDAMELDPDEARNVYAANEARLQELMDIPLWADWHERTLSLRRQQRAASKAGDDDLVDEIKAELADHLKPENLSEELQDIEAEIKQIKSFQKVLNRNSGKLADETEKLLSQIEDLEVMDLNALERVTNAGIKLGRKLDRIGQKAMDAEAKKLFKRLEKALKAVDTQKRMMSKVYKGKPLEGKAAFDAYKRMALLSERRDKADAKANELIEKIESVESFNVEEAQAMLRAVQDLNNVRVRDLNAKRALRQEKLAQKIEEITPERQAEDLAELRAAKEQMEEDFDTTWRKRGAEDLDTDIGAASFASYGREIAEELAEKIMGLNNPIAGLEILGGKRGPELARTLNLPLDVKSKYLETDMEKISRIYMRRIAPDIEMYRAFGSVNGGKLFDEVKLDFRRLRERLGGMTKRPKSKANYRRLISGQSLPKDDAGNVLAPNGEPEEFIPWEKAEKEEALGATLQAQKNVDRDLRVMVSRLRHQRGVPQDPRSIAFRAGRVALDINVFRFMGGVVLASLADIGRPVMRYGFSKTIRNGYLPFFRNLERVKMSREEAKRLGVALDPILHNRAQAAFDMWNDYASRKSLPERVTGFLANKTGFVAGYDRWTAEMKQITASIVMGELSDALEATVGGAKVSAKKLKKAQTMLAELGIGEPMAHKIWDQMNLEDGGNRIDGVMLPNTESWTDVQAKRAYAAALNQAVDDAIVTPGLDRPNWVDHSVGAKLVAQFRSFTFTATNRILLRSAQEPDMAMAQGLAFSLALGALSYYTWSVSRGEGSEVLEQDWEKWADEAVARSGLLGVLQEPWNFAQKIPGLSDKVTFSGTPLERRRASGLLGQVFGPSVDLAERSAHLMLGMSDPTQSTVHTARTLSPYQNVFWLRRLIDNMEDTANTVLNIPERRE